MSKNKNNRTCIVCEQSYYFCPSCSGQNIEPWRSIYHDENCRKIFKAVSAYVNNEKTKEETIERLEKYDLSNKDSFKKNIREAIDELYGVKNTEIEKVDVDTNAETNVKTTVRTKKETKKFNEVIAE